MGAAEQLDDVPQTREERVQACIRIGPSNWVRGKTGPRLAEEWGVSLAVVEQASSEAWRRIKAQDATWVREVLCADLDEALRSARDIEDLRDQIRTRIEVAKTWAPIVGAVAPSKHTLDVRTLTAHDAAAIPAVAALLATVVAATSDCAACTARILAAVAPSPPQLEGAIDTTGEVGDGSE